MIFFGLIIAPLMRLLHRLMVGQRILTPSILVRVQVKQPIFYPDLLMTDFELILTLSLEEKILFIKMVIRIVTKDGEVADSERQFIRSLANEYRIPKECTAEINQKESDDELFEKAASLLDRRKSLFLLKELFTVANTDDDLADSEIDFLIALSEALQIESEKVTEINKVVLEQLQVMEHLNEVLELDSL